MESFKESLLPTSKEEVDILNQSLSILIEKNQLFDKDLEPLCKNNNALLNKIKYCLIETNAARLDKFFETRILPNEEYAKRFISTNYYSNIYNKKEEDKERKLLELNKLKEDLRLAQKQSKFALPAFIISIIAILVQVIPLIIAILK